MEEEERERWKGLRWWLHTCSQTARRAEACACWLAMADHDADTKRTQRATAATDIPTILQKGAKQCK